MKKRAYGFLAILLLSTFAFGTATVTGKVNNPGLGVVSGSNYWTFELQGCGNNPARATQPGEQSTLTLYKRVAIDASGNSNDVIVRNDQISCGGQTTSTLYLVTLYLGNSPVPGTAQKYRITSPGFDLNTATAITVNPVVVAPTGDSTYARLDTGNIPGTGALVGLLSNFVSVKQFGARCDGTTDDQIAIQAAITYVSGLGGGTVILPIGTCFVSTTGGTVTLPGDDGTCSNSGGSCPGGAITAEAVNTMPYILNLPSNVRLIGTGRQGSILKGPWTYGSSAVNTSQKILINIAAGTTSFVQIEDMKITNAIIPIFHSGILVNSSFRNLHFSSAGFDFVIQIGERITFKNIVLGDGAGIVIGGWWTNRDNQQNDNGGYCDKCVFDEIELQQQFNWSSFEVSLEDRKSVV